MSEDASGPATSGIGAFRRALGVLLVGGGAFLVTMALLLRFHVYATLALLPAEVELAVQMEDESATYLDTTTWRSHEEASVVRRLDLAGTPTPGNPGWATWTVRVDTASAERMLDHVDRRVIVDRETATAVNCCGEHVAGDRAVRQAGLVLHWPAGAPAGEFPFYDADIRAAPLMRYDGAEEIAGVHTRRYVQTIEATQVPGSAGPVPARVLGLDRSGTVTATRWLELVRTLWIEPVSGRLVHATEERHETLRAEDGGAEVTALEADLVLVNQHLTANAEAAESQALLLLLTRDWAPLALGALGPLLAAAGVARILRDRAAREARVTGHP